MHRFGWCRDPPFVGVQARGPAAPFTLKAAARMTSASRDSNIPGWASCGSLGIIGASLSEPHTSVTALCTRVSIRLSMDRSLTGNFKSADLQNF